MIGVKIVSDLDLSLDLPDRRFWEGIAVEAKRTIHKRTLSGYDVHGDRFKPYSRAYLEKRVKGGRTVTPNLTFTGRMLNSIRHKGYSDYAKISLSGREGFKAWENQIMGREFFDLSENEFNDITKAVGKWLAKHNRLK